MARRIKKRSDPESKVGHALDISGVKIPAPRSEEDLDVETFCIGIEIEEIDFSEWQNCHKSLDITVPVFLTKSELFSGNTLNVTYCRQTDKGKEIKNLDFHLPESPHDGLTWTLKGFGDQLAGQVGDLNLIIRLKG